MRFAKSFAPHSPTSRPSKRMSPDERSNNRQTMPNTVDLPAPLGPMNEITSP